MQFYSYWRKKFTKMNKAIFLDRDGTINIEKHYLYKSEDFEFLPGVLEGLTSLQNAGYLLIMITNQSGIARGYFTENDYLQLEKWMLSQLLHCNILISRVYHCPHLPDAIIPRYRKSCNCRKPGLELFKKATTDFEIDLSQSYAIGDKLRDLAICGPNSAQGFLIYSQSENYNHEKNIYQIKGGVLQAALQILEENQK